MQDLTDTQLSLLARLPPSVRGCTGMLCVAGDGRVAKYLERRGYVTRLGDAPGNAIGGFYARLSRGTMRLPPSMRPAPSVQDEAAAAGREIATAPEVRQALRGILTLARTARLDRRPNEAENRALRYLSDLAARHGEAPTADRLRVAGWKPADGVIAAARVLGQKGEAA